MNNIGKVNLSDKSKISGSYFKNELNDKTCH